MACDSFSQYKVLYHTENTHYIYEIIEKNKKQFFKKQWKEKKEESFSIFQNEIHKHSLLDEFTFVPKLIEYHTDFPYFLIYEYIKGESLSSFSSMSILDSLEILIVITKELEKIHQKYLVHCDIKPSNILLDEKRNVYITDLGNMKYIGGHTHYGSKRYCCLEQLGQERVSVQFDIYAVGILMYELITGYKAYENLTDEELIKEKKKSDLSICNIVINMPSYADTILSKAICPFAKQGYNSISLLKNDLYKLQKMVKKV